MVKDIKESKKSLGIAFIALLLAIVILLILFFIPKFHHNQERIVLEDGSILPPKICQELGEIVVIHEAGCPACAIAVPRIQEIEREVGVKVTYFDLAIDEDKNKILTKELIPVAVPTVLIKCKAYVGVRNKEEYLKLITG